MKKGVLKHQANKQNRKLYYDYNVSRYTQKQKEQEKTQLFGEIID